LLLGPATGVRTLDPESVFNFILAILDTISARIGPERPAIAIYVIWCPGNCCIFVVTAGVMGADI
jgi:hypothetical protein